MSGIFITGTDTGVGKTMVTGLLARYLREKGYRVATQKWVQTGCSGFRETDANTHLRMMGLAKDDVKEYLRHILPYSFRTPSSPHLASAIERRRIAPGRIIKSYRFLSGRFDWVLAEGSGGILVPLTRKELMIDIAGKLGLAALVVAGNKVGAINHTLLTIESLRRRRMKIIGVVFNNQGNEQDLVLKDNPRIVESLSRVKVFGVLPRERRQDRLYRAFAPIGEGICKNAV